MHVVFYGCISLDSVTLEITEMSLESWWWVYPWNSRGFNQVSMRWDLSPLNIHLLDTILEECRATISWKSHWGSRSAELTWMYLDAAAIDDDQFRIFWIPAEILRMGEIRLRNGPIPVIHGPISLRDIWLIRHFIHLVFKFKGLEIAISTTHYLNDIRVIDSRTFRMHLFRIWFSHLIWHPRWPSAIRPGHCSAIFIGKLIHLLFKNMKKLFLHDVSKKNR